MIITRTPLRTSLVGGGTDMPAFYKHSFGAVVSMAIDKYVYVAVNQKFDRKTRVSYSKTENVNHPMELRHDIIRESLLSYNVNSVEVATVADIPGGGTGLGSSSALAVGLVRALHKYIGNRDALHRDVYAELAYGIERDLCLHPVGKQDHYASACGNLNYFIFEPNNSVISEQLDFSSSELADFESRFVLLWTGRSRDANAILKSQEENMNTNRRMLAQGMRDLAVRMRNDLDHKDFSDIGAYLHANWELKRQLAQGITNEWIDQKYREAIAAGAEGGKLCGAGGGGFFLFYGRPGLAPDLEKSTGLKHVPFHIDTEGSRVIYATEL
jgi:D-glycero-alpha-D-manno-heptose-7-phosphate kinase